MGRGLNTCGAAVAAAAAMLAGGCAGPLRPQLIGRIGDDSAAFSMAYARAANNQVLINILEARDRLPRHYLTMSGISDAPSASFTGGVALGPLGVPVQPFGASSVTGAATVETRPSYGVTPLTSENLAKAIYTPLSPNRFEYYWRINWADDVLIYLFARNVSHGHCINLSAADILKAGAIHLPAKGGAPGKATCLFKQTSSGDEALKDLVARITGHDTKVNGLTRDPSAFAATAVDPLRAPSQGAALLRIGDRDCHTVSSAGRPEQRLELLKMAMANAAYAYEEHPNPAVAPPAPPAGAAGHPPLPGAPEAGDGVTGVLSTCSGSEWDAFVFANGPEAQEDIYVVEPRSLDEIVYYLGKLARGEQAAPMVDAPGVKDAQSPLFVIHQGQPPCGVPDSQFAAGVDYRGSRYWAGPPVPLNAGHGCGFADAHDRTATVLTLLTQLFAMQAAPEALAPPNRFVVN